jgi:hypothetical protein
VPVIWVKLSDCVDTAFYAGTVFRFSAAFPDEAIVDYMLILDNSVRETELKLVVTTGGKAGYTNITCKFPHESYLTGALAIKSDWLSANWQEWIYPDTDLTQIFVMTNYPVPISLPE